MGLDTVHLRDGVLASPKLPQGDLGKQGQHHRCRWGRGRAGVPWALLVMRTEGQTDLSLDHARDQQADDGEHRQRRVVSLQPAEHAISANAGAPDASRPRRQQWPGVVQGDGQSRVAQAPGRRAYHDNSNSNLCITLPAQDR